MTVVLTTADVNAPMHLMCYRIITVDGGGVTYQYDASGRRDGWPTFASAAS